MLACWCSIGLRPSLAQQSTWTRHVIDDSLVGADGVRLADFNGDELPDIVTGWEESGVVRLYLHPGAKGVREEWPAVTVAEAGSPEDAVPFDVDGDGRLDVVSCHEGKTRDLVVAWNNASATSDRELLRPQNWQSEHFPQFRGDLWMYALPLGEVNGRPAMVIGSKGAGASITLIIAEANAGRNLAAWKTVVLRPAGWIMSLQAHDMDDDGDLDVVFSDRRGPTRGVGWLEQPDKATEPWTEHDVGGKDHEVLFLDASPRKIVVATRNSKVLSFLRQDSGEWKRSAMNNPEGITNGKAVRQLAGGRLLLTANTAASKRPDKAGFWIRSADGDWEIVDPASRVKFDRIELVDLDRDGDLDALTCEERRRLGVVWYENPGDDDLP